jgi:hypothetical protein
MATPEFKKRKDVLYAALRDLKKDFPFARSYKSSFSLKRDGFKLDFDDGTELYVVVNRQVQGMAPGEFLASSAFAIYRGPVIEALRSVSSARANAVGNPWVVGSSWYLVPELRERQPDSQYKFLANVDAAALAQQIIADIQRFLFPPMIAFAEDYWEAARIVLEGEVEQITLRDPFAIGLALLKLSGRLDEAERLAARAASLKEKFYDYSPKQGAALIARFRKA